MFVVIQVEILQKQCRWFKDGILSGFIAELKDSLIEGKLEGRTKITVNPPFLILSGTTEEYV